MMLDLKRGQVYVGLGTAASRFLGLVPSLLLALLSVRMLELAGGMPIAATSAERVRVVATAIGLDVLATVRYLPLLLLYSLPFLLSPSARARFWSLGVAWSALVLVQVMLVQYFLTARVPLGADLFAYSWDDLRATMQVGASLSPQALVGLTLPLALLWLSLALQAKRWRWQPPAGITLAVFAITMTALLFAPTQSGSASTGAADVDDLVLNKAAFFLEANGYDLSRWRADAASAPGDGADGTRRGPALSGFHYLDPRYPFLHAERTPDALGPHFTVRAGPPPNLVLVIVEGLGRSFSGPRAALGSFTPFLDDLAGQSLYWENFLANQGRTFGALPSILGSLPFGDHSFNALGADMPPHETLLSVLKAQGYRLKFYAGFDTRFDNERLFLQRQGVDALVDIHAFGAGYALSPGGDQSWGFADNELISLALAHEARDSRQPFVTVIQTSTMHVPYTFPGQAAYTARLEQRLDDLGVPEDDRQVYRAYRNIYTSILYTDDVLRRFFEEIKRNPAYQNTIFVVTGDHRLPEIPMTSRIDRYHVPLIVFSPLLKAPARIKAVSSHFDLTPSLLALLSHHYGIRTPRSVTWLGTGLDMAPDFRNGRDIPIKQTKGNLDDFVTGRWYLSHGQLYALSDGMAIEPARDAAALASARAGFARFRAANRRFMHDLALRPPGSAAQLIGYDKAERLAPAVAASAQAALAVREVRVPLQARAGELAIEIDFGNAGALPSSAFVPLVVLLSEDGRELSETYGAAMVLAPGQVTSLRLTVNSRDAPPGRYFMAVLPSDPQTGKPVGPGRYRIPVRLHD
ncbi:MAG: LTA synthase family protein [Gemmatimonadaceae bacterium]